MSSASALTCIHCGHLVKDGIHVTGPSRGFHYSLNQEHTHRAETY